MKSFTEYLTEVKLGKVMRRLKSKNIPVGSVERGNVYSALASAEGRQRARAMSASIAGEHEKAGAIASVIDVARNQRQSRILPTATRTTFEGEKFAGGIADKIADYKNTVGDMRRALGRLRTQGRNYVPNRMDINAISRIRSGKISEPHVRDRNLYHHILRSHLAGAAVRMGGSASDVAPFVKEVPSPKPPSPFENNRNKDKYNK